MKTYIYNEPRESVWNNALQALMLELAMSVQRNKALNSNPDVARFLVRDIEQAAEKLMK